MTGTKEVSQEKGAKPTPAPWVLEPYSEQWECATVTDPHTGNSLADVYGKQQVAEANARLIAAAPELLVFAKKVIAEKWLNDEFSESDLDYDGMVALAVAAIGKAAGK